MDNTEFVRKLLDTYAQFTRRKLEEFKSARQSLIDGRREVDLASSKCDWKLKISYSLSMILKLIASVFSQADSGAISFDSYKYYKERYGTVNPDLIYFQKAREEFIQLYQEVIIAYESVDVLIPQIHERISDIGAATFIQAYISHRNENNKLWSLFYTCTDIGVPVDPSVNKLTNGAEDKTSSLSISINHLLNEYLHRQQPQ